MEDLRKEWWKKEIDEQFRSLNRIVFYIACGIAAFKVVLLLTIEKFVFFHVVSISFTVFLAYKGGFLFNASPYYKILYAFLLTEWLNYSSIKVAEDDFPDHKLILMLVATMVLVCLQLPFFYSDFSIILLLIKFEYQWYINQVISDDLFTKDITVPISALVATIVFYLFFRHFQKEYSYELFLTYKDLEASQKENKTLLKLIPGGLMVFLEDMTIERCNNNILRFFDEEDHELILEKLSRLDYSQDRKFNNLNSHNSLIRDIKDCFKIEHDSEITLGITDGNLEWRAIKIHWINKPAVVVTMANIEHIVKLEQQTAEISIKNLLLSSASHELRTPAYTISHYTDSILEEEEQILSKDSEEKLRIVSCSSKMLLSLIGDILDFSRMVKGDFNIQKVDCCPYELIEECYDIFKFHIALNNISFKLRIDPNLPEKIYTDPIRLKQIILNLLSNAKKFTINGSIEICAVGSERNKMKVIVRDTGVGIPADKLEAIFNTFESQCDNVLNPQGCGLGLSISNILAKKLGDKAIKVSSVFEQGSSFSFKVNTEKEEGCLSESDSENEFTDDDSHRNTLNYLFQTRVVETEPKILIVDDDSSIRTIIGSILKKRGISYSQAKNGYEAIEFVKKRDLRGKSLRAVLMDIEMGGLDGWETTQIILEMGRNNELKEVPAIIGHSANHSEEHVRKSLESGMKEILQKPSKPDDLVHAILKYTS